MSDVTNLKTITNNLLFPVTVKNGENTQQTFTVGSSAGWNGDLWIPWVTDGSHMNKSIFLSWQTRSIYIFQNGDHLWFASDNNFDHKGLLAGNNSIRGEKGLVIAADDNFYLV